MNLARHAAVMWRFRVVAIGGLVLGCVLAFLAAYQVTWDGGPSVAPRGEESWTSESTLLVTQRGFPEGRVTLPIAPTEGSPGTVRPQSSGDGEGLEFADPTRFSALAQLYAQLAVSDRVLDGLPQDPSPSQIEAVSVEGLAATQLPVIKLTTTAGSAAAARALNNDLVESLRGVLSSDQAKNDIAAPERTQLDSLNAPAAPVKIAGRSHTASILAFLLCILGGGCPRAPACGPAQSGRHRGCLRLRPGRPGARRGAGAGDRLARRSTRRPADVTPCAADRRGERPGTFAARARRRPRGAHRTGALGAGGAGSRGGLHSGRPARPGQSHPGRCRAAVGAGGLSAGIAGVADAARGRSARHPLHPDPPLHGRRRAPHRARALSHPDRRRPGLLAVRALRRSGRALARNGPGGSDHRPPRGDPAFACPEHRARELLQRHRAQAGHLLHQLRPVDLLHRERDPARAAARSHVAPARGRRGGRGARRAVRMGDGHQPLQRAAPGDPNPALRRSGRAHRARDRGASARLGAAPNRVRCRSGDADPADRLPPPARPERVLARLRRRPHPWGALHRVAHRGPDAAWRCW